jgi:DNA-binding transcriptional regulator YdaS (Cro superfamily)
MNNKLKLTESAMIDCLGGTAKVSRMCKCDPATVSTWRIRGIPHGPLLFLAARIEKESHGLVTRKDLFPNNFWLIWPEMLEKSNSFGLQQEVDEE